MKEGGASFLELVNVVVQQLRDEVNVCQNHPPAAVPVQTELVEGLCLDTLLCLVGGLLFLDDVADFGLLLLDLLE